MTTTGNTTIYIASLHPRLADDVPATPRPLGPEALVGKKEGTFPRSEALLLLFRSVAARLDTGWLNYLARLNKDNTLAVVLADRERPGCDPGS